MDLSVRKKWYKGCYIFNELFLLEKDITSWAGFFTPHTQDGCLPGRARELLPVLFMETSSLCLVLGGFTFKHFCLAPKAHVFSQGLHLNIATSPMPEQGVHRLGRPASWFSSHGPWRDAWRIKIFVGWALFTEGWTRSWSSPFCCRYHNFFVSCAQGERGRRRLNSSWLLGWWIRPGHKTNNTVGSHPEARAFSQNRRTVVLQWVNINGALTMVPGV